MKKTSRYPRTGEINYPSSIKAEAAGTHLLQDSLLVFLVAVVRPAAAPTRALALLRRFETLVLGLLVTGTESRAEAN